MTHSIFCQGLSCQKLGVYANLLYIGPDSLGVLWEEYEMLIQPPPAALNKSRYTITRSVLPCSHLLPMHFINISLAYIVVL